MSFTVRDWMIDLLVFVDPDTTVADALATMRRRYIHSVIVNKSKNNPEYGILTSTDICDKIIADDRHPGETLVKEIMTTPIITASVTWSLQECTLKMKEHHIHHMPVADEKGQLIGMISATDFLVAAEAMGRAPGERIIG
ncbi:MAG TPA: CBS domain-containing protein [Anaerolineaceae bacterium]|jgi:signal-transduction protein with cAMP-binding, CBS, and nucleotidyltransferase domain|nr:CBS domain-containing protein [Anaerolineaceae bacterium]